MKNSNSMGKGSRILRVKNLGQCIGCYTCMLSCATTHLRSFSLGKSAIAVKTSGGYQGRIVINICRGCLSPVCVEYCQYEAIKSRRGGGVIFDREKCTGCKQCISKCIAGAIGFDKEEKKAIFCIQCGICVESCPHDVIGMEKRE